MNLPAEIQPTEATVSAYETLRGRCLDPHPRATGELGLSVLLRQGMLEWTRTRSPAPNTTQANPASLDSARVLAPLHEAIIHVMVTMTMSVHDRHTPEYCTHELGSPG
jgi:hypothetical protein